MAKIICIELDSSKDIAKVPSNAKPLCVVASGDDTIVVTFEVEENATLRAFEFQYPEINATVDLTGFTYCGSAFFDENSIVIPVYCREM